MPPGGGGGGGGVQQQEEEEEEEGEGGGRALTPLFWTLPWRSRGQRHCVCRGGQVYCGCRCCGCGAGWGGVGMGGVGGWIKRLGHHSLSLVGEAWQRQPRREIKGKEGPGLRPRTGQAHTHPLPVHSIYPRCRSSFPCVPRGQRRERAKQAKPPPTHPPLHYTKESFPPPPPARTLKDIRMGTFAGKGGSPNSGVNKALSEALGKNGGNGGRGLVQSSAWLFMGTPSTHPPHPPTTPTHPPTHLPTS